MSKTQTQPTVFSSLLPSEILTLFSHFPPFRAKQIFKWISDGAASFDTMTNIPLNQRQELTKTCRLYSSVLHKTLRDPDGTIKLQIQLEDGPIIETILLVDASGRKTACVSCQAGCPMGCTFCKTGSLGFTRNLNASEIVEQFFYLECITGKLQNIVFMGMGEPLLNLDAIRKSLEILSHPDGRALSLRRVTLSTCGIIDGIYDLAKNGPPLRLAVSLTSADERLREKLMPVARANPLAQLAQALKFYTEQTGRRCTLELALLGGLNTSREDAKKLIAFAGALPIHINLIPWNPVKELPYSEPSIAECSSFRDDLKKAGLNVTIRTKRGTSIGGACGQLGKIKI